MSHVVEIVLPSWAMSLGDVARAWVLTVEILLTLTYAGWFGLPGKPPRRRRFLVRLFACALAIVALNALFNLLWLFIIITSGSISGRTLTS